jgi:hypothetical protein
MKKNVLKASAFLLGTALIVTSCVKTEELDSVKAIREAKAAMLTADVNYKNAQAKIELADANYKRWSDSVQVVSSLNAANLQAQQTQISIDQAKISLQTAQLQSQLDQKKIQDQIDAFQKSNSALAALAKDFNAYYFSGTLSSGIIISKGIYNLKSEILNDQTSIINLKQYLTNGNRTSTLNGFISKLNTDSTNLKGALLNLATFQNIKNTGVDAATLQSAKTQLAAALNDWQAKSTAYQNAATTKTNADNAYLKAYNDSASFYQQMKWNGFVNGDQLQQAIKRQSDLVSTDKSSVDYYTKALADTTTAYNAAQATYNAAQATLDAAQATVTAVQLNGGTPTASQTAAVNDAQTALNKAGNRLNAVQNQYYFFTSKVSAITSTYQNDASQLTTYQNLLQQYNNISKTSVYSLYVTYLTAENTYNDAQNAVNIAQSSYSAASNLYNTLENILSSNQSIDNAIANINTQITQWKNYIVDDNANISNIDLLSGTESNNNEIARLTKEITDDQALIDNYTAAAAALKTKIDAQ